MGASEEDRFRLWAATQGIGVASVRGDDEWNRKVASTKKAAVDKAVESTKTTTKSGRK